METIRRHIRIAHEYLLMRKKIAVVILLVFGLLCHAEEPAKVAILEIVDRTGAVPYGQKMMLRSCLVTSISLAPGYEGYDRIDVGSIFQEQDFQRTGYVSNFQIHELGKMTGASYVLVAEAAPFDDNNLVVAAKILDVETARITNSSETVCPLNSPAEMREKCIEMAKSLLGLSSVSSSASSASSSLSVTQNAPNGSSGKNDYLETWNGINMEMVFVEGGDFLMGSTSEQNNDAKDDEHNVRRVTVRDFYIGRYEVTQSQWESVMGTNISQQRNAVNPAWPLGGTGPDYPMYYVSWEEASEFCRILSQKTGKTYRLPTEAEWEYAARGGCKNDGTKYAGSNTMDEVGWYNINSGSSTHKVGTKAPNGLGIYDMSGNVWEWCNDWYSSNYETSLTDNPKGPSSGLYRVLRGGCWYRGAVYCRVSNRTNNSPTNRNNNSGFRVICLPK